MKMFFSKHNKVRHVIHINLYDSCFAFLLEGSITPDFISNRMSKYELLTLSKV